ncbi:MrcB family domain-containing protein (plasmid) [Lysinibacillus sp. fkY74-1]
MVGLKDIKGLNIHMGNFIEEFFKSSNIKKGEVAAKMSISRNTLTSLFLKEEWPKETLESFLEAINELTPKGMCLNNLKLFPIAIPAFIEKGKGVVKGVVGQAITVGLVDIFENVIEEHSFKSNLIVQGSVGQGNAARSVWVGIRDDRISKFGFSAGVYVVLLFDSKGEFAYLSIAYAVSDKDVSKLESMAEIPAKKIMEAIEGDERYAGIQPGSIDLGETTGTVAADYEKSVIVSKKYLITDIDKTILESDVGLLLDLFYDFVFEEYFEVLEKQMMETSDETSTDDKKKTQKKKAVNKYSTIDPETHLKLLAAKAEHNSKIGKLAEEFVFNSEIERLKDMGREDLVDRVKHVSKEKDGLGYDIESIDINPSGDIVEKFIEVKGSSLGGRKSFDFFLTEREMNVGMEKGQKYYLEFVEYVGFEKQRIFDVITPFSEPTNDDILNKRPVLFKCSYKKR